MPDININSNTSVARGIVDTDRMLGWTSAGVVKADTLAEIIATIKPGRLYTGADDPTTSPPSGSLEGDVYIRSTGQIYKRGASAYTDSGISLRGTDGNHGNDGKDGNHGTDGKDGAPGSRWYAGTTMPSSGDPAGAIAGDFYLQANGHVFERGSTNWSSTSIDLMARTERAACVGSLSSMSISRQLPRRRSRRGAATTISLDNSRCQPAAGFIFRRRLRAGRKSINQPAISGRKPQA